MSLFVKKEKTNNSAPKKDNKVMCTLSNKECIHSNANPDDGVYDNCRLCDVYYELYLRF